MSDQSNDDKISARCAGLGFVGASAIIVPIWVFGGFTGLVALLLGAAWLALWYWLAIKCRDDGEQLFGMSEPKAEVARTDGELPGWLTEARQAQREAGRAADAVALPKDRPFSVPAPAASVKVAKSAAATPPKAEPKVGTAPAPSPAAAASPPPETTSGGTKPKFMTAARETGADDLKLIKGVGPKMEKMLNGMGIFHFDQIAGWSAAELAWVDDNLENFKGRASRDDWIPQAKELLKRD